MVDKKWFFEFVVEELKSALGTDYHYEVETILKNNGVRLIGLNICEQKDDLSVVLYLNPMFQAYKNGASIERIVNTTKARVVSALKEKTINADILENWELANDKIVVQVINYEKNRELLKDIPHIRYLDLAVIFRSYYGHRDGKILSSIIKNHCIERWGISVDDLYQIALENSRSLLPETMGRLTAVVLGWDYESEFMDDEGCTMPRLFVLSNKQGINGASVLLYSEEIHKLADTLNSNLILLPSSVHEVLLLKDDGTIEAEVFRDMVRIVNQEDVPAEDVLSDNVYIFDRQRGEIRIAE